MTDLDRAIDNLRLSRGNRPACCNLEADVDDLLAALDAARGEAVAWVDADTLAEVEPQYALRTSLYGSNTSGDRVPLYAAPPAALAVPEGYAEAIKAVQEMMPPRDFRPSAQVWLTGNQVNELHARLDAAAMLAAAARKGGES